MNFSKLLVAPILIGSIALTAMAPAKAQQGERAAADARVDAVEDSNYDRDDDGFDWGLLGLLGLFGLMPRKRTEVVVQRDDPNRPNGPTRT